MYVQVHTALFCLSWFFQGLDQRVKDEQRLMDEKIVAEMDQKVLDQQNTLEKAGVPGFYITSIPQVHIMHLCTVYSFIFLLMVLFYFF